MCKPEWDNRFQPPQFIATEIIVTLGGANVLRVLCTFVTLVSLPLLSAQVVLVTRRCSPSSAPAAPWTPQATVSYCAPRDKRCCDDRISCVAAVRRQRFNHSYLALITHEQHLSTSQRESTVTVFTSQPRYFGQRARGVRTSSA